MSYTIRYDLEKDCIIASMDGIIGLRFLKEFAKNIADETKRSNCNKIFNNVRNIDLNLSTFDIYSLPVMIKEAGIDQFRKRALVVSNNFKDVAFFETVSVNQVQNVKTFRDPETAMIWLGIKD